MEGVTSDGLFSSVDFFPTLLDFCGVSYPEDQAQIAHDANPAKDGASLFEVDINKSGNLQAYFEAPSVLPGHSIKQQLTGDTDNVRDWVIIENDEDYLGLKIRTYVNERYKMTVYPGEGYGELFDLHQDPQELHNCWDDPDYQSIKTELYREFLEAYVLNEGNYPKREVHA